MIFFTPRGVVEKTNTPERSRHPLKRTKQAPESTSRARARYSYPQQLPSRYRSNERPAGAIDDREDAMAHTNRTASASHRRWRQRLITQARQQGQTECPLCGATITWDTHQLPTSPEADHITPVSRGGLNTLDNGQIICRTCNRSKGNRTQPNIKLQQQTTKTLIPW